jgi:hypothetical protein
MKYPNFFIIGAPKCGTTSLAAWLAQHKDIFMSLPKEPHYFSRDLNIRSIREESEYFGLFENSWNCRAIGEASTWYLYSRVAVPEIERRLPEARYIIMTRNMGRMAFSLYGHNLRSLHEDRNDFWEAWHLQDERKRGKAIPRQCREPAVLQYRDACSLGTLLSRFVRVVPAHRWLHVSLENLTHDPGREYRRCLDFLGLPFDGFDNFQVKNLATRVRSRTLERAIKSASKIKKLIGIRKTFGIWRLNHTHANLQRLTAEDQKRLDYEFSPETNLLAGILKSHQK